MALKFEGLVKGGRGQDFGKWYSVVKETAWPAGCWGLTLKRQKIEMNNIAAWIVHSLTFFPLFYSAKV